VTDRRGSLALRAVSAAGWSLTLVALLALAWLWRRDRVHAWELPAIAAGGEVELVASSAPAVGGETWLVAVNPGCPHCVRSLAGVRRVRAGVRRPVRLAVLLVDTPARPGLDSGWVNGVDQVWWDSTGVWRRRWGHRTYGEVMRFDAADHYRWTVPPLIGADSIREATALVSDTPPEER
jgi:hypothetical protein